MVSSRSPQKVEKVTITLIPKHDERHPLHVPTTFSREQQSYTWKRSGTLEYMIVPTRVSSGEVRVDVFLSPVRGGKRELSAVARRAEEFIRDRIGAEWHGLTVGTIGRPVTVAAPRKSFVRGTIEDMLGAVVYDS